MAHHGHTPETPATRFLQTHQIPYTSHVYAYEEHGGTAAVAQLLNVEEHSVIKTLIFEDDSAKPLIVLMHGDCKVSTKELARQIGCKKIEPCKPEVALRHSGYLVGGTSPFGTKKVMPVYIEHSILELPLIYINGGRRGVQVTLAPQHLQSMLRGQAVRVALNK